VVKGGHGKTNSLPQWPYGPRDTTCTGGTVEGPSLQEKQWQIHRKRGMKGGPWEKGFNNYLVALAGTVSPAGFAASSALASFAISLK